jgi:hypothetical protein
VSLKEPVRTVATGSFLKTTFQICCTLVVFTASCNSRFFNSGLAQELVPCSVLEWGACARFRRIPRMYFFNHDFLLFLPPEELTEALTEELTEALTEELTEALTDDIFVQLFLKQ